MSLPFSTAQPIPRLKDLLDSLKRDIFLTLNCHTIATIQKFEYPTNLNGTDYPHPTVQATINYARTTTDAQGNQSSLNYPILVNLPVLNLCGGTTALTFPIAIGDQALILFNDRDLDNWFAGARSGQVNSPRLHHFSDGIALVGLNTLSSYDTVRALLTTGLLSVGINPSNNKVLITNDGTSTTLNTLLQNLITAIKGLTVAGSSFIAPPGGGPCTGTATVIDTGGAVTSAGTAISELLE